MLRKDPWGLYHLKVRSTGTYALNSTLALLGMFQKLGMMKQRENGSTVRQLQNAAS